MFSFFENFLLDIRVSLRVLRRNLSFSMTAVLVLGLGLGSTAAVFSVVDRLLFRALPYPGFDQMISLGITIPWMEGELLMSNDYFHLREHQAGVFSALTSWTGVADCDLSELNPQRLSCAQVESNFLPSFGVTPILGRNFSAEEDRMNAPQVALVSYGLWKSRFGGNPAVLDTSVRINGLDTRIIGVLPSGFELPNLAHADFVLPQGLAFTQYRPHWQGGGRALRVFGRLRRGVSAKQALSLSAPYMLEPWMKSPGLRTIVRSLREYQIGDVKLAAWLLLAATIAILLIVYANLANLMLAKSVGRQREVAVRAALGAGQGRLLQQSFTESLLLCGIGAVLGTGFAGILLLVFKQLAPAGIPRIQQASLDARVLFVLLLSSLVFAIAFAVISTIEKPEPEALKNGSRIFASSRLSFRRVLTAAQVAISLVLLSFSVLLIESLAHLESVAPGIAVDQVTAAEIAVGPPRYSNAVSRRQFFEELAARLRSLPGVKAVAISDTVPPIGFVHTRPARVFQVVGAPSSDHQQTGIVAWRSVSPDYFKVLSIPIRQGRPFNRQDETGRDNSIIINQTWAHVLFGRESPLGKAIKLSPDSLLTVIGVAADVKNEGLAQPPDPEYYVVRKQVTDPGAGRNDGLGSRAVHWYDGEAFIILRGSAPSHSVAAWIRSAAAAMDPTVPLAISSMQSRMDTASERPRFTTFLLSFFALCGLVLAAIGLYGLVSFLVVQRTREMGVRMAIGATPGQIAALMLKHAVAWTLSGVLLGAIATSLLARYLRGLVFEVPVENPQVFCFAAGVMIAVTMAAALIPSLRAARIDPISALRQE